MAMLKPIVQQNHIGSFSLLNGENLFDGRYPVLVYHNKRIWKLLFDLKWFISHIAHLGIGVYNSKSFALAFIAPAEYGDSIFWG